MRREEQVRVCSRRTASGVQRNVQGSSQRTASSERHSQRAGEKRSLHNEPKSLFKCEFSSAYPSGVRHLTHTVGKLTKMQLSLSS
jgi:hypothetical protein